MARNLPAAARFRPLSTCKKQTSTVKLEVERKFPSARVWDLSKRGKTPFRHLPSSKVQRYSSTHNIYYNLYDDSSLIKQKGAYMRKRNKQVEAKVRWRGEHINSSLKYKGCDEVARLDDDRELKEFMFSAYDPVYACVAAHLQAARKEFEVDGFWITLVC